MITNQNLQINFTKIIAYRNGNYKDICCFKIYTELFNHLIATFKDTIKGRNLGKM